MNSGLVIRTGRRGLVLTFSLARPISNSPSLSSFSCLACFFFARDSRNLANRSRRCSLYSRSRSTCGVLVSDFVGDLLQLVSLQQGVREACNSYSVASSLWTPTALTFETLPDSTLAFGSLPASILIFEVLVFFEVKLEASDTNVADEGDDFVEHEESEPVVELQ